MKYILHHLLLFSSFDATSPMRNKGWLRTGMEKSGGA
jgi:hypothetical protein